MIQREADPAILAGIHLELVIRAAAESLSTPGRSEVANIGFDGRRSSRSTGDCSQDIRGFRGEWWSRRVSRRVQTRKSPGDELLPGHTRRNIRDLQRIGGGIPGIQRRVDKEVAGRVDI